MYIQTLYAFFAPPFAAVFVLGILFRRINAQGATVAVFSGFILGIAVKVYLQLVPNHPLFLEPFPNQAIINWIFCVIVCVVISLMTPAPRPEQVIDQLTINWKKLNIFSELGTKWYNNVVFWWLIFVVIIILLVIVFSGLFWCPVQ